MQDIELRKLLAEFDDLLARVETTVNPDERTKLLQDALFKACRYIKGLNKRIPKVISEVLERGRFNPDQLALPLRDIASADEQLEVFRDKEILLDFLRSGKALLRDQMQMSNDSIEELIRQVEQTYDLFMDEKIAKEPMLEKFEKLELFFCRPPWGGPGGPLVGPKPDVDGPSGVTVNRSEKVRSYLETFSSVGSFILELITFLSKSDPVVKGSQIPLETIPYPYQVLGFCLISGFIKHLDANQEIPQLEEVFARGVGVTA